MACARQMAPHSFARGEPDATVPGGSCPHASHRAVWSWSAGLRRWSSLLRSPAACMHVHSICTAAPSPAAAMARRCLSRVGAGHVLSNVMYLARCGLRRAEQRSRSQAPTEARYRSRLLTDGTPTKCSRDAASGYLASLPRRSPTFAIRVRTGDGSGDVLPAAVADWLQVMLLRASEALEKQASVEGRMQGLLTSGAARRGAEQELARRVSADWQPP